MEIGSHNLIMSKVGFGWDGQHIWRWIRLLISWMLQSMGGNKLLDCYQYQLAWSVTVFQFQHWLVDNSCVLCVTGPCIRAALRHCVFRLCGLMTWNASTTIHCWWVCQHICQMPGRCTCSRMIFFEAVHDFCLYRHYDEKHSFIQCSDC